MATSSTWHSLAGCGDTVVSCPGDGQSNARRQPYRSIHICGSVRTVSNLDGRKHGPKLTCKQYRTRGHCRRPSVGRTSQSVTHNRLCHLQGVPRMEAAPYVASTCGRPKLQMSLTVQSTSLPSSLGHGWPRSWSMFKISRLSPKYQRK